MSGRRLIVGSIIMGVALPVMLFFLLRLHTIPQLLTIAAATFVAWGVADLLSQILDKPRLHNRTPGAALREDVERRHSE